MHCIPSELDLSAAFISKVSILSGQPPSPWVKNIKSKEAHHFTNCKEVKRKHIEK